MGGIEMGITEDQKMMLAAAYVRNCTDTALLLYVINEAHDRLNDLLEAYNEDIQE
jgi:hypothetical protein